jgi:hypothetical protein
LLSRRCTGTAASARARTVCTSPAVRVDPASIRTIPRSQDGRYARVSAAPCVASDPRPGVSTKATPPLSRGAGTVTAIPDTPFPFSGFCSSDANSPRRSSGYDDAGAFAYETVNEGSSP